MKYKYTTEKKEYRREWTEVIFSPDEFARFYKDNFEGDDPKLWSWDYYPHFVFENGGVRADESWDFEGGRVSTSSFHSGVMGWSDDCGEYVKHVHMRKTRLGQLVSVVFTLDDDLQEALQ